MSKWQYRQEGKRISSAVIAEKSTANLRKAKKFVQGLLDLRASQKLTKTYIDGIKRAIDYNEQNKVYVVYNLDGTATGRLSCASYNAKKAMGVSFHTLPREKKNNIRSLFVAPDDWKMLAYDYKAMELRILAHVANEGNMQNAFNQGADLHTYTAQLLFNKENITKQERQIAKAVSFLIVYGGGAFNLSETTGITMARAKKIIKKYENAYPGIFSYMESVNSFVKEHGYALSIFGRKRHLPNVYSRDQKVVNRALRQALNFTIQSPASDILVTTLLAICERLEAAGLEARVIATVHDSIEVISPPNEVEEVHAIVYDEMVNYHRVKKVFNMHFNVPLDIDIEEGRSFGEGETISYDQ